MRLIQTRNDLAEGASHLMSVCPVWARVMPDLQPLPLLRSGGDGFAAICGIVSGQQVSIDSADAVVAKMRKAGLLQEAALLAADDQALRDCGLSRPKARYLRAIAAEAVDWAMLAGLEDDAVRQRLTALPGIGPWSAEIYLKFSLGRADAFAAGDLALQEGARMIYDLPSRPDPAALTLMAEDWRPWRAVAARALWVYYLAAKGRKALPID